MRQVGAVAAAAAVFTALLALAELTARRWKVEPELSRKLAHMSSGVVAACLPVFMSFPAVVVLALLFVPYMVVSRRIGLFPAVHGVERSTLGEVWFPLGVAAAAAAVPQRIPYAFGVLVMGLSDAFASLAGQRHGRRGYRGLGARKTWVGSAVFLLTTAALALAALALDGPWTAASLGLALVLAGALTVLEGVLGGGADNVALPLAGAALLALAS